MRDALRELGLRYVPSHLGLAYDVWAPVDDSGKVPDDVRADWLEAICNRKPEPDYSLAYRRWHDSFGRDAELATVELAGRLLIGHGNPAPTEVGLTVHHTWGVPVIPGSALKGLLAHYVETVYGPAPEDPDAGREDYRGVGWDEHRIAKRPGRHYATLFGAPDSDDGGEAARGFIEFHDAWYVPPGEGCLPTDPDPPRPFAPDVLTVHQKSYYDAAIKPDNQAHVPPPNDYDSPVPVAFLTVAPRTRFLVALTGPAEWRALAMTLLLDALAHWGVGGKTSAGYGRSGQAQREVIADAAVAEFEAWLEARQALPEGERPTARELLDQVRAEWLPRLLTMTPTQRELAVGLVRRYVPDNKRTREGVAALISALSVEEGEETPPAYPPELVPFVTWLEGALSAGGPEAVLAAIEDEWLVPLSELPDEARQQACALLRERLAGASQERVDDLTEQVRNP